MVVRGRRFRRNVIGMIPASWHGVGTPRGDAREELKLDYVTNGEWNRRVVNVVGNRRSDSCQDNQLLTSSYSSSLRLFKIAVSFEVPLKVIIRCSISIVIAIKSGKLKFRNSTNGATGDLGLYCLRTT